MKERSGIQPGGTERSWIEPIVERVVGRVFDSHIAQLRSEIVRRVAEEIAGAPEFDEAAPREIAAHHANSKSVPAELASAVAEIQLGSSQREILRALLDTGARYAARVALFVVKGSHATGWQARGFANNDAVKDFALDETAPAVARAMVRANGDHVMADVPAAELDSHFLERFGAPASGEGRIFQLILKDKVAALIYCDSGTDADGFLDAGALELLVLSTSAWLEVNSLRKHVQKESSATHTGGGPQVPGHSIQAAEASSYPTVPASPAFNDPFASHVPAFAPSHAMAAAASAGEVSAPAADATTAAPAMAAHGMGAGTYSPATEVQSAAVEVEPALAEPLPTGQAGIAAIPEMGVAPALSPEDQDVHRKAQRFARLLVDEIKLYNQAKMAEGRKNKDLYDRLKEPIDKSQITYHKRYGNTVAASGNYFQHEIMRSLAEDDRSIMGANFRQ